MKSFQSDIGTLGADEEYLLKIVLAEECKRLVPMLERLLEDHIDNRVDSIVRSDYDELGRVRFYLQQTK